MSLYGLLHSAHVGYHDARIIRKGHAFSFKQVINSHPLPPAAKCRLTLNMNYEEEPGRADATEDKRANHLSPVIVDHRDSSPGPVITVLTSQQQTSRGNPIETPEKSRLPQPRHCCHIKLIEALRAWRTMCRSLEIIWRWPLINPKPPSRRQVIATTNLRGIMIEEDWLRTKVSTCFLTGKKVPKDLGSTLRGRIHFYQHDLKEKINYNPVLNFYREHHGTERKKSNPVLAPRHSCTASRHGYSCLPPGTPPGARGAMDSSDPTVAD